MENGEVHRCLKCGEPIKEYKLSIEEIKAINEAKQKVRKITKRTDYCNKCWSKKVADVPLYLAIIAGDIVIGFLG